jgi:hypothetical protein
MAIHSITAIETPKVFFNVGIATLTILTSRADMVAPRRTVERINHFQLVREEMLGCGNCNLLILK